MNTSTPPEQVATQWRIRPAQPTWNDALAFADLAEAAARGVFRLMLGKRFRERLANAMLRPNNEYNYQYVHFIEVEGQIAGMICVLTLADHYRLESHTNWLAVRYLGLDMIGFVRHLAGLWPSLSFDHHKTLDPQTYFIHFIAVYPQFRGRGLSNHLMAEAERQARERGCPALSLNVVTENHSAIALYEKCGFEIRATSPKHFYAGAERGKHAMVKDLM